MKKGTSWSDFFAKYATIITLFIVFIIFVFAVDEFKYIKVNNLLNILKQVSILSIVALGVTAAMAVGEFDMSTGSVVGFSGVLAVGLITKQSASPEIAIAIVVIMGIIIGLINSFLTTSLRIPSIIVTLGMQSLLNGFIYMYSGGKSLYGVESDIYVFLGQSSVAGIPVLVLVMLVFVFITYFIMNKTIIGRYIYATGGNEVTARLSGIPTRKYIYMGMIISASFSAIAGILLAARLGSGQPSSGASYTMQAVGAVFIGMTTVKVGKANVIGTVVGVFLLGIVSNGLNMMGWTYYMQNVAEGVIMIGAVAFAAARTELKFFK